MQSWLQCYLFSSDMTFVLYCIFQAWSLTKGDTLQQHTRCLTAGSSVPETKVYLTNCQSNDVKQVSGKSLTHHALHKYCKFKNKKSGKK